MRARWCSRHASIVARSTAISCRVRWNPCACRCAVPCFNWRRMVVRFAPIGARPQGDASFDRAAAMMRGCFALERLWSGAGKGVGLSTRARLHRCCLQRARSQPRAGWPQRESHAARPAPTRSWLNARVAPVQRAQPLQRWRAIRCLLWSPATGLLRAAASAVSAASHRSGNGTGRSG